MSSDRILDCVRKKLNEEKIKLWLSPYTVQGNDVGCYPQDMIERFSKDLQLSQEIIKQHFEQLRYHALDKLAAKQKFEATGIAVLKLKILGKIQDHFQRFLNLEVSLNITGKELCQRVAKEVGVSTETLKLITQGKVVNNDVSLKDQNIRNNTSVMVMVVNEKSARHRKIEELHQTKRDAELLTDMDMGDPRNSFNLQIADQNGQVLDLPVEERKALAIAMTLHEKSRTAMKQRKYEEALPILLEADNEFTQCTAKILDLVDNYALLNLDIVWCYLSLRSINYLPDAERRLKICQTCFDKSYGPNLERLQALKGDKTKERVLFTRLHLLQGIVAYHHGNIRLARTLLNEVKVELNFLKVDDEKLSQVMGMGYSSTEARLALRASCGNVEGAVNYIISRREEKEKVKQRNEEERKRKVEEQKLGKTMKGEWINPDFHKSLTNMGYSYGEAQQALQHSENSISLAVQILQEHRHLLKEDIDEAAMAKMISLGFGASAAKRALEKCQGNMEKALAKLFSGETAMREGNKDENPSTSTSSQENEGFSSREEKENSGRMKRKCSNERRTSNKKRQETISESRNLTEEAIKAVNRLAEEIPEDEEDHLDLNMSEEEVFLMEYVTLLNSVNSEINT